MAPAPDEDDLPDGLREQLLARMLEAFPEAERPAAMLRLLDEVERLHREHGAEPPAWIGRLRERLRR